MIPEPESWLHMVQILKQLFIKGVTALKPVDLTSNRPDINWCKGRLLELPGGHNPFSPAQIQFLVVGSSEICKK